MELSPQEYAELTDSLSPKTPVEKTLPAAFVVGGSICALGQIFWEVYLRAGLPSERCAGAVAATLIILTAILTGLQRFDDLANFAGAGALVPISGFANAMVSPALEFRTEGLITGVGAKMFVIAGPVIVYGTVGSVIYGIFLVLFGR